MSYKDKTKFNDKKAIIEKYIDRIVVSDENRPAKHITVEVYFNKLNIEPEVYLIDTKYKYGIELFEEILIPLSVPFKNYNKRKLKEIAFDVSSQFKLDLNKIISDRDNEL